MNFAGVNMSLLSKVMSPRLSRGVFNCGLLSTEAGTLARALADGLITLVGRGGEANLLNFTMIPTLLIVVFSTLYTWVGYYTLYWFKFSVAPLLCGGASADFEISIQTHFQVCKSLDRDLQTIPNFFNLMINSILLTSSNQIFIFCNWFFYWF